jgi:hypothetical protein
LIGLQTPKSGNLSENLPKVSGPPAENSRFWETLRGDFFDRHCVRGLAVDLASFPRFVSDVSQSIEQVRNGLKNAQIRVYKLDAGRLLTENSI